MEGEAAGSQAPAAALGGDMAEGKHDRRPACSRATLHWVSMSPVGYD